MAGAAPPFDVGAFFASQQATLFDVLTPHLDAYDLAALARAARMFCAWPARANRKCKLVPRHKFGVHGHRDDEPIMLKRHSISLDMVMVEHYTCGGRRRTRMVAPGAKVSLTHSSIDVDLVCDVTGRTVEKLYRHPMFKHHNQGKKATHGYRWRRVKFQIRETLSSDVPSPGLFRLRATARVARLGQPGCYGTYEYLSRRFAVVNHFRTRKLERARANA